LHPHAKKSRKKQPVAPPDAPPYREAISGHKQELDQEATPGRRIFFSQVDSFKTQAVAVVCLDNAIPFLLLEDPVCPVG
jgi:hypothetical protein